MVKPPSFNDLKLLAEVLLFTPPPEDVFKFTFVFKLSPSYFLIISFFNFSRRLFLFVYSLILLFRENISSLS
jgi:hypothetical protein